MAIKSLLRSSKFSVTVSEDGDSIFLYLIHNTDKKPALIYFASLGRDVMVLILWNSLYEARYFYHIIEIINYASLEEEDREVYNMDNHLSSKFLSWATSLDLISLTVTSISQQ